MCLHKWGNLPGHGAPLVKKFRLTLNCGLGQIVDSGILLVTGMMMEQNYLRTDQVHALDSEYPSYSSGNFSEALYVDCNFGVTNSPCLDSDSRDSSESSDFSCSL